jgi:hypothetical protein
VGERLDGLHAALVAAREIENSAGDRHRLAPEYEELLDAARSVKARVAELLGAAGEEVPAAFVADVWYAVDAAESTARASLTRARDDEANEGGFEG